MLGQTLGHYKILDKLGAGGMGEVYRAEDTTLKRQVALKVLPPDLAANQERLDRFQREAESLAALNHPNIVHVYTVEEDAGTHFLTMELVEGKPLSHLIRKGGMPLERIFDIAIPLSDALATAHEKGVIHRDLKPANIMVTEEGRVKVLDFGLAKLRQDAEVPLATELPTEPLTHEGTIVGTMPYMSPEQLEGKEVDARSDIFSLGVMLYEMATGDRPFKGDSTASLITAIMSHSPREVGSLRAELPHQLSRIIRHCLEKDPEHRFQSAKDVRNELQDLHHEKSLSSAAQVAPKPESKPAKKSVQWPLVAIAWAGAAILLAVLVAIWLGRSEAPSEAPDQPTTDPEAAAASQPPRIVVLPFENLGAPEDEYFADGVSEEITSRLAAVSGLQVISRTSAMQYKDHRPPLRQIGQELDVDYVLEGTVRWERSDEGPSRLRITPQLIRVSDDVHLWSERYDQVLSQIFSIQSQIAAEVIDQVGVVLLSSEHDRLAASPTENLEAYEAYLRGLDRISAPDWTEANYRQAVQMFQEAVQLDPSFAAANARLSLASSVLYWEKWDGSKGRAALAREAADRALLLSPNLPEGHLARGAYLYRVQRDYSGALAALQRARALQPNNSEISRYIGAVLRRQGRGEEAAEILVRAVHLDPRAAYLPADLGFTYCGLREFEKADQYLARSIALAPEQEWSYAWRAENSILSGDLEKARTVLEHSPTTDDPVLILEWIKLTILERSYQEALQWISRAPKEFTGMQENRTWAALWQGHVYQLMNDSDKAVISVGQILPSLEHGAQREPELPYTHLNLAWALAVLGREAEAMQEARLAAELLPLSQDAYAGTHYLEGYAHVATLVGDESVALDQIELMLSIPCYFSAALLRLDPTWDPLRDHPRFQALLEKYGQEAG